MREHILRELLSEYAVRRAQAHEEEQRRAQEAAARNPRIAALLDARLTRLQACMREAFAHPQAAMDISGALRTDMLAYNARLREALLQAGLPEDYLQPLYTCADCRDTGFVGEGLHTHCHCLNARLMDRLCRVAGLGLDEAETFERYRDEALPDAPLEQNAHSQRAYTQMLRRVCEKYADAFPETEKRNLLFIGQSGLGKTFLLNSIGHRVLARGYTPYKITAYRLFEAMRDAQFGRGDADEQARILGAELLLLDDLGTEPLFENVTIVQLFNLLNERTLRKLHTVISTNLTPRELTLRYSERVTTRLMDQRTTVMLRFLGKDIRLQAQ